MKFTTILIGLTMVGTAFAADFTSFQLASTTITTGNILQTRGGKNVWVATSTLGLTGSVATSTIWGMFSATYPIIFNNSTGVISTGFSTSTINIFSGLNTFNGGVVLNNATATSFGFTSATGTSLFSTQGSFTNLFSTNATTTALSFTNATGTVLVTTTASSTNFFSTNGVFRQATTTAFSFTNATGTILSLTHGTSTNLFSSNLGATSLLITNGTSTSFGTTNLSFTGITGSFLATNLQGQVIATTSPQIALSTGVNGFLARWTSASALSTGLFRDNGTVAGVNATSSTVTFNVQGNAGTNDAFNVASSTGTSFFKILANGFMGVGSSTPSNQFAVATGSILVSEYAPATSTAQTIDWTQGNQQRITMGTAAMVVTFTNVQPGQKITLIKCNGPATAGALTFATATNPVLWSGGTAPTFTTTLNKCDTASFLGTMASGTMRVFGSSLLNF